MHPDLQAAVLRDRRADQLARAARDRRAARALRSRRDLRSLRTRLAAIVLPVARAGRPATAAACDSPGAPSGSRRRLAT